MKKYYLEDILDLPKAPSFIHSTNISLAERAGSARCPGRSSSILQGSRRCSQPRAGVRDDRRGGSVGDTSFRN